MTPVSPDPTGDSSRGGMTGLEMAAIIIGVVFGLPLAMFTLSWFLRLALLSVKRVRDTLAEFRQPPPTDPSLP